MSWNNSGGKRYSARDAKAFNMGRAYGAAKANKRIRIPDSQKGNFKKGYNSVNKGY